MRRALAFGTFFLAAAMALWAGTPAANAQWRGEVGEVCIQQNGVYLASIQIAFREVDGHRWAFRDAPVLAIGQSHCAPFTNTDGTALLKVNVVLGHSRECRISLKDRTGKLMAVSSGTTLDVGLTCP